jgi:hypothetical protein
MLTGIALIPKSLILAINPPLCCCSGVDPEALQKECPTEGNTYPLAERGTNIRKSSFVEPQHPDIALFEHLPQVPTCSWLS